MSDVDLDGKDEIVFGALILEDDLTPRTVAGTWFPFPAPEVNVNLTEAMHNPDADDRFNYLGHGDAFHVGDFNPGIPGAGGVPHRRAAGRLQVDRSRR